MEFRHSVGLLLFFLGVLSGCKSWQEADSNFALKLPSPRLSDDSVAVDLTFVRIPPTEKTFEQTIWAEVDEQCVPPELRAHLNMNGIRCGVIGGQLPSALVRLLDESGSSDVTRVDARKTDVLTRRRHQRWQSGQRVPIIATVMDPSMAILHHPPDDSGVTGRSFANAQGFLGAKAHIQKDGQVRVELTPEIHYGDVKQQWVAGEGTFQWKSGKERYVMSDLLMSVEMSVGQALLVSCTPERSGLGQTFFIDTDTGDPQQRMLFLRFSQTQKDELFDDLLLPPKDK
ncbi:MAG: hypothetical protein KDB27_12505 [Planctomycetales bacterium]|nr:hypothetical protein [Planctomycetales bacterium]